MDKTTLELCVPCQEELRHGFTVKVIESGVDRKIKCDNCKKRRFGSKCEVTPKNTKG